MVDGITAADIDIADLIRMTGKPIVLAASKADNSERVALATDLYELGLGDPVPISAYHNHGLDELMERILEHFQKKSHFRSRSRIFGSRLLGEPMLGNPCCSMP